MLPPPHHLKEGIETTLKKKHESSRGAMVQCHQRWDGPVLATARMTKTLDLFESPPLSLAGLLE
jgi:hypothetical protein